jgi:hypothetical protein
VPEIRGRLPGGESVNVRAGDSVDDLCRVCKNVRGHTVIAADSNGAALRVICDYCGSQHNYRGGEAGESCSNMQPEISKQPHSALVTERERRFPMADGTSQGGSALDLEMMLRRIIREETGLTAVPIAEKWKGGDMVLRPGKGGLQEKAWPIETFFHKVIMLRNRLRVLEQQINGADIPEELKVKLQGYITGCYGTLTSFNILFSEEEDRFQGSAVE